jgi:hypothetical protein
VTDDPHTLDANAVAGMLHEIFGAEMTAQESECAHCGNRALVGTFRVYDMHGPGVVLRCSACTEITLRVVRRPDGTFLVDASETLQGGAEASADMRRSQADA